MRILTGFVFILNIALWILGIIIGYANEGGVVGFPVIICYIAFLVAWHLSGGIAIAPVDYFFQPEWDVFKTKLKWSNSTGGIIGLISFFIIASFY
ncbi:hypothetical protein ES708_22911 [subsurface metagenome]